MTNTPKRFRPRVPAAVGSLLAALVLALLPPPAATQPAAAAEAGEDSAVTVSGRKGPHDDFSGLKVTVHQTEGLRSQGVRVSWEGGKATPAGKFTNNFLQIMQCWGDDPAGPDREQCVFGATGQPFPGQYTAGRSLSTDKENHAYDPRETEYKGDQTFAPFQPVGGLPPTKSRTDWTYFGPLDTNEQAGARTFANGRGEVTFEVQDGVQAPHLGCGLNTAPAGSAADPRSCWLVIVPRGTHDADGTDVLGTQSLAVHSSPLSAANWEQRMVVPLEFLPVDDYCPSGQPERPTAGSELVTEAVTSWQPKLCTSLKSTFAFTQGGEEVARNQVLATSADTPLLGFTVDPAVPAEGGGGIVHAPVAVSGLAIAFFMENPSGLVQEMKLTPRIVAKMLTHSYQEDVPGRTPEHVSGNPESFAQDPEFLALNPDFPKDGVRPRSLMVPLQNSDTSRVVWNWLQSDPEARDFLSGEPDPHGTRVNPYYEELDLAGNTTLTEYPKVDPTTAPALANGTPPLTYTVTDLDPYTADLHEGALRTLRGNNNRTIQWGPPTDAPPKLVNDPALLGTRAVLAVVDAVSAERYGLKTAALRNADGTFVKPSADTLAAGAEAMRPWADTPSVLKADPARAKGTAYPLTAVAYAVASVNQDAEARAAYADLIRYVAGPGQTPGLAAGELPPGYAPLPQRLRDQAESAADALERGTATDGTSSGGGDSGGVGSPGGGGSAGGPGDASAGGTGGAAAGGGDGGTAGPDASQSAANGSGAAASDPQKVAAESGGGITRGEIIGIIRWVLIGVLILGGGAGLSGPVMLHLAHRRIS
ncbi:hypothetical protein ACFZAG_09310 [Streptomyces sp. NPDC012403]|uniref:hypothetical protein n=1 Tax=Streptomyces sp. NPDC012403 TaxID=3364831 RepID=UPI0036E6A859